jgi:SOS-response transcriptional repressor LexA
MDNNLGDRIKFARNKAGFTQVELAKKIGITYPTLNKYERNHRVPNSQILSRIAKELHCNPGWLLTGEGNMLYESSALNATAVSNIPVLGRVPAGFPDRVSEEIVEYISLSKIPSRAYALIVKGSNMGPNIKDGDYAIFSPHSDIQNGDIIVVNDEWGESTLKRYRTKDDEVLLSSDNPEYPTHRLIETYKVIGKVIEIWRKVKF